MFSKPTDEYQVILDNLPDMALVVDKAGIILWSNKKVEEIGYQKEELVNQKIEVLIPSKYQKSHQEYRHHFQNNPVKKAMIDGRELEIKAKNNDALKVDVELTPFNFSNNTFTLAVVRQKPPAQLMAKRASFYEKLLNESQAIANIGTWDWDLRTGYLHWSKQTYRIFGLDQFTFGASYKSFLNHVHPEDVEALELAVSEAIYEEKEYDFVHRIVRPDLTIRHVQERAKVYKDALGKPIKMIGTVQDVTDAYLKDQAIIEANETILAKESELTKLAYYDTLTHLSNRNYFIEYLKSTTDFSSHENVQFALMFIDVNGFSEINNAQGYLEGDRVLKLVADQLTGVFPEHTLVARLGGDQFAVLIKNVDYTFIKQHIDSWMKAIVVEQEYAGFVYHLTCSIGIVTSPAEGKNPSELLKKADSALFWAKIAGKNHYRFYDSQIAFNHDEAIKLQHELEIALDQKQLEVYYQPQIDIQTPSRIKAECLIRWNHPEKGLLLPASFIDIAEHSDLIIAIGEFVLHQACAFINHCRQTYDLEVNLAINISAKQLLHPDFLRKFQETLLQSGTPAQLLEIEITENLIIQNIEKAKPIIEELRLLGCHVALDDFGTGYSSLSYLSSLDIDTIKIDRAFVLDLPQAANNNAICRSIISLSHALGKSVIAEGVENKPQLDFLIEIECDQVQGFYYSKALKSDDFVSFYLDN